LVCTSTVRKYLNKNIIAPNEDEPCLLSNRYLQRHILQDHMVVRLETLEGRHRIFIYAILKIADKEKIALKGSIATTT
jgi:hypothetical protein